MCFREHSNSGFKRFDHTRGFTGSRSKSKPFYLHSHSAYSHQSWYHGDLP